MTERKPKPPPKDDGRAGKSPEGPSGTKPLTTRPPKLGRSEGPGPHDKGPKPPKK